MACLSWPLLHCCSRPPTPLLASSPARPAAAYPAATLELRRLQRAPAAACSTCCSYTRSSTHSAATPLRRLPLLPPLLPALVLPLPRPPLPCELAARLASARQRTHTNSFFKLRRLFLPRDPFTAATASPIDSPGSSTHVGLAHQPSTETSTTITHTTTHSTASRHSISPDDRFGPKMWHTGGMFCLGD